MAQVLRGRAAIMARVRVRLKTPFRAGGRAIAACPGLNRKTAAEWRGRDHTDHRPLGSEERRSSFLEAGGLSRLPSGSRPQAQRFQAYEIGCFHVDMVELRRIEGKTFPFVAVDRASKPVFARRHQTDRRTRRPRATPSRACSARCPAGSTRSCRLHDLPPARRLKALRWRTLPAGLRRRPRAEAGLVLPPARPLHPRTKHLAPCDPLMVSRRRTLAHLPRSSRTPPAAKHAPRRASAPCGPPAIEPRANSPPRRWDHASKAFADANHSTKYSMNAGTSGRSRRFG